MKRSELLLLSLMFLCILSSLSPALIPSQVPLHEKIILKGIDGSPLSVDSKEPYSPRKTCGSCHDYDQITKGYHFQQGRTDGAGKIIISDRFDAKYPWNLSAGMYGKHSLTDLDASQLAKKTNAHPSEIDKSSFFFVQNCGPCHPGGGFGEYDRRGNLYYNEETKKFGYELSGDDPRLDGDYTPFSMGNADYGASWDRSGLSEADCLICHLKGYRWKERGTTLRAGLFKYGPTVGAGWARVKFFQEDSWNPKAEEVEIDYSKKEVADFENLHLQIIRNPRDENCRACHAASDGKKRGGLWSPETDIHKSKGFSCVSCHPADKEHNFAKGNTIQETVRDDLDHTMASCEDCHYKGRDKKAPRYRHPFSPKHMRRIACQTCHIPFQTAPADLVYDLSTGTPVAYDTSKFLSADPLDPRKKTSDLPNWFPTIREFRGRIVPTKSLVAIYFGDLDEKTNVVTPIFLWKIRGVKKPPLKDHDGDGIPEINTTDEIKAFLKALNEKDSFGNPVANHPVLMKGGFLYQLNKKSEVEKVKHEQAELIDFSLSHHIVSGPTVIGSKGCKDCHSKNSPFFLRRILIDPYDEKGKPVYIETWERMGIDKQKLERLLSIQ
ncbi:MAG: multiheme c-type cytochrome [Thermodesulfobacteriota bacterium]